MMFADSDISDELAEKIVAFVDREAGRDAPLTADDEAMVRGLIAENPAVRALVEELRATNAGLDTLLDDVAAVDVPEGLVALIKGHGDSEVAVFQPKSGDEGETEESDEAKAGYQPPPRRVGYGPLAAAASIALLISSGALYYIYNSSHTERLRMQSVLATATEEADSRGRALADARAELRRLAGLAENASSERRETAGQLLANEERIQDLEVERAALEGRYAALEGENERLSARLQQQQADLSESEATRDRIASDLAAARTALTAAETRTASVQETLQARVDDLAVELDQRRDEVQVLTDELGANEQRSEIARTSLAAVRNERAALRRDLARLEADRDELLAEKTAVEQAAAEAGRRLAALEAEAELASDRLATVVAGLEASEEDRQAVLQQMVGLEADLAASRSWLNQISQYHRVYASTARRHLVEVGADELDHIQTWLTGMLGRQILVPDLTRFDVTFAGARLLAINEKPVAQLVYRDGNDQPLALCVIPMPAGAKAPTLSTNGELNLVDWRDDSHGYAVVGWSDPQLLSALTGAIQPVYDL
jgi:anti-sigma factor RsiW